jgi:hypothetical protein
MDFNEKGSLFLSSVYSLEMIEEMNKYIREFLTKNNIYTHLKKRHDVVEDNFFVNNTYTSLDNYKKMQYYYLPVIDNRGSHNRTNDVGMIDIYNIEKLFPNLFNLFDIDLILTILYKITDIKWKLLRSNIQICSNVSNPNSFHFENIDKCIKYTIYLSDIMENEYGPPIYIERTHIGAVSKFIYNDFINVYFKNNLK